MNRLATRIADRRLLALIGRYLRAGVCLPNGHWQTTTQGVPQGVGGPLSPLLGNIVLDELDIELEKRGLRFTRYADDFLVFVKSMRAARRVLASLSRYLKRRLRLTVNKVKSRAVKLSQCQFLGFELRGGKLRWTITVVNRFKDRVRELTGRSRCISMTQRIDELNRYITGWLNYFGYAYCYRELLELDCWVRRRMRFCYWKQWKRPVTRRRHLLRLGANPDEVKMATRSRKGYWRMSSNRIVQQVLSNEWLWNQGVPNMRQQWIELHYGASGS